MDVHFSRVANRKFGLLAIFEIHIKKQNEFATFCHNILNWVVQVIKEISPTEYLNRPGRA